MLQQRTTIWLMKKCGSKSTSKKQLSCLCAAFLLVETRTVEETVQLCCMQVERVCQTSVNSISSLQCYAVDRLLCVSAGFSYKLGKYALRVLHTTHFELTITHSALRLQAQDATATIAVLYSIQRSMSVYELPLACISVHMQCYKAGVGCCKRAVVCYDMADFVHMTMTHALQTCT